ncbi:putative metal-binding motif-containing protein [Corallococcus sp. EGB]|uniref:putative metal-binding motif-containing protein n=1 Tax=Corallococcus sp. EGB TaxID=1521117 RepID=UPI001CC03B93|nr:putative metal-binding motif-containing protein [Corallococcus sp. EGB]
MRLFLLAMLTGVLAGCSKPDSLKTAALKVEIHYEGFRPGCVTLTVTDQAEVSRQVTTNVNVPTGPPPGTLSVAVFRQAGWSYDVKLLAAAKEQNCDGKQVVTAEATASLAKDGITPVGLSLSALDNDGDGFVAPSAGGTDCDDADKDRGGPTPWYVDEDGDKYGSSSLPPLSVSCEAPAFGNASKAGDCNDSDNLVHPGQEEFRCDERDDNCNGLVDEAFSLGEPCKDAFACPGVNACDKTDGGVACVNAPPPTVYFRDEDGDGKAGADGGVTCDPPPPGTFTESSDCDESSVYVAAGLPEVCDRMDNNCVGGVDEAGICGSKDLNWEGTAAAANRARWNAIAVGQELAWLAGIGGSDAKGNVLKLQSDGGTSQSNCPGQYQAAWVSKSGQVFLAGDNGSLASQSPTDPTCTVETTKPDSDATLNGIVGFDSADGGPPMLYAVASNGYIFKWAFPAAPVRIAETGTNLRAIHGTTGPDTLLAVGAVDNSGPNYQLTVLGYNPATGAWLPEKLPPALPFGYLTGVSVVTPNYAYAVGDKGVFLERDHGEWRRRPFLPADVNATGVKAFGKSAIYATTVAGDVLFFNGDRWESVASNSKPLRAIDGASPTRIGAAGLEGTSQFFRWPK